MNAENLKYPHGPNVEQIRAQATRVIRGRMPAQVRRELMAAVKAGVLGRLKKDGLRPEIFYHPDHKHGAIDRQKREAAYAVSCIAGVIAGPAEVFEAAAVVADYPPIRVRRDDKD